MKNYSFPLLTVFLALCLLPWALSTTNPEGNTKNAQPEQKKKSTNEKATRQESENVGNSESSQPIKSQAGAKSTFQTNQIPSAVAKNDEAAETSHSCNSCSSFPAKHPQEDRELSPVEKYSIRHDTFPAGVTAQEFPESDFKTSLLALPVAVQEKVVRQLVEDRVPTINLNSLNVEEEGTLFFVCNPPAPAQHRNNTPEKISSLSSSDSEIHAEVGNSAVPISEPPARSSKPGSPNTLYIDFNGHVVSGTAWGSTVWNCLPLNTDSNPDTFSPEEQSLILRVWEQVSEDYAPFDINVTTVEPETFGRRTARALVTHSVDQNGVNLPYHTSGGVAFINVFNTSSYATRHNPAFIYYNRQSSVASHIADSVSHEVGHNLGLYHDGLLAQGSLPATEYYNGHGSGNTSWGPIMGSPFWKNVSQWSKGEYNRANNLEDDISKITAKLGARIDDHSINQALQYSEPVTGIIEQISDVDTWTINAYSQLTVSLQTINLGAGGGQGGNLHGAVDIFDQSGTLVASLSSSTSPNVSSTVPLTSGKYTVQVRSTSWGTPLNTSPTGYTQYGSIGQYSLSLTTEQPPSAFAVYTEWAQNQVANQNTRNPYDSTESNRITNLEKFAYGISEGVENAEYLLPTVTTLDGITAIRFRAARKEIISYRVLQSSDLDNWVEIDPATYTTESISSSDGTVSMTVRATTDSLPVFLRVALSLPEN